MDHQQKNDKTEIARELGRKQNKRGDRNGESNDSPEIPDRRVTSDIPGLPSGKVTRCFTTKTQREKTKHYKDKH